MRTNSGTLKQKFLIKLDLSKLIDHIAVQIEDALSTDFEDVELEVDYSDHEVDMSGEYKTDYTHSWCEATLYDPPEDEMEREYIGEEGTGLLNFLPEQIAKLITLRVIEDEDNVEYEDFEPDPDMMPGGWDRRWD